MENTDDAAKTNTDTQGGGWGGGVDFFGVDPLDREFTRVTRLKGRRIKNKIKIK